MRFLSVPLLLLAAATATPACGWDVAFEMGKVSDAIRANATRPAACPCEKCDCGVVCPCAGPVKAQPVGRPLPDIDAKTLWSYPEGAELARRTGAPLVTYVGGSRFRCQDGPGHVTAYAPYMAGVPGPTVIVSVWVGNAHLGYVVDERTAANPYMVEKVAQDIRNWAGRPPGVLPQKPSNPGCPGGICPPKR